MPLNLSAFKGSEPTTQGGLNLSAFGIQPDFTPEFVSDPAPGAARRLPSFPAPQPLGTQPLTEAVGKGFEEIGFRPVTDEEAGGFRGRERQILQNLVTGGIRGAVEFPVSIIDALTQSLARGSIDPAVEAGKSFAEFIPSQIETVGTALGAKRLDPQGRITGINPRTGLAVREPIPPSEKEVSQAQRQLREQPEGPVFAALLSRGAAGGVKRLARPPKAPVRASEAAPVAPEPLETALQDIVGRPQTGKTFFHGTAANFKNFDISKSGTVRSGDFGKGVYLTPSKGIADSYRADAVKRTDPRLTKAFEEFREIERNLPPVSEFNSTPAYNEVSRKALKKFQDLAKEIDKDKSKGRVVEVTIDPKAKIFEHTTESGITDPFLADAVRAKGFDVLSVDKGRFTAELVVLNPEVIKTVPSGIQTVPTLATKETKPVPKKAELFPKVPKPAEQEPIKPVERVTKLTQSEIARVRADLDLSKLDPVVRKTAQETLDRANEGNFAENALTTARAVNEAPRVLTTEEHTGMVLKVAERQNSLESSLKTHSELLKKGDGAAAQIEFSRSQEILNELDVLTEASNLAGTEAGRSLQVRRMRINRENFRLASVVQRAQAAKGKKLSAADMQQFERLTAENQGLERKLTEQEAKFDKAEANRERIIAERIAERIGRRTAITAKSATQRTKIRQERTQILKELGAIGFRVNDITGLTVEGAHLVGKLATTYIKEGAVTLAEAAQKVINDLPELTERDVIKALAQKSRRAQRKARVEVTKRVTQLKRQAQLIEKVEQAEKGVFEPPKKRAPVPSEIRTLQKRLTELRNEAFRSSLEVDKLERALQKINELQDQLTNQFRAIKKRKPIDSAELQAAKKKANEIRSLMRTKDEIARLDDQLRTGDFEIKEPTGRKEIPLELEKAQVQVKRKRKQIREAIDRQRPASAMSVSQAMVNFTRTTLATGDVSGLFRQNVIASFSHPLLVAKQLPKTFQATFSEAKSEQIMNRIDNSPISHLYDRAKLDILDPKSHKPTKAEENFSSELAEKIPGFGAVVRASNRNMTTMLNLTRVTLFDKFIERAPNATLQEMRLYADFLNKSTGRGNLGQFRAAVNALSLGIFAPRFSVSRFQAPLVFFKAIKVPRVRKQIARDLGGFLITGGTVLTLAHLYSKANPQDDVEVGIQPQNSDWGKIRIGSSSFDIWGGFQQPARLIFQLGLTGTDAAGITERPSGIREQDPFELLGRFASYKVSPLISLPRELIRGKTAVGEEVTPSETATRAITMLFLQDAADAYRLEGPAKGIVVGAAAFTGIGVSTFERRKIGIKVRPLKPRKAPKPRRK